MTWLYSSSKKKVDAGKQRLINRATNRKAYTPYMKNRINKIKTQKDLNEVNKELAAVIFTMEREKVVLEREARALGVYTNVKNNINNYDGLRGTFIKIRNSFTKIIRNRKK